MHIPIPLHVTLVLAVSQPCRAQPRSVTGESRKSPATRALYSAAKPLWSQAPYSDPRYRAPAGLSELHGVAARVAKSSGRMIHWQLSLGKNPGPLAKITGGIHDCKILIHPLASRLVSPNTWAFIFGHEFAHRVEELGSHGLTNPANELKADIAGARYAMAAGYRLESFLGWMLAQPEQATDSHGSLHQRVHAIAAHFGIPNNVIRAESERHLTRWKKSPSL